MRIQLEKVLRKSGSFKDAFALCLCFNVFQSVNVSVRQMLIAYVGIFSSQPPMLLFHWRRSSLVERTHVGAPWILCPVVLIMISLSLKLILPLFLCACPYAASKIRESQMKLRAIVAAGRAAQCTTAQEVAGEANKCIEL